MVDGAAGHLRTHLHHLLQTHKLYLILWKNRLSISVALLGKASSIAIVSVDFNIMQASILRLRCARLKNLTGPRLQKSLRSISNLIKISVSMLRFSTRWTSFDILAFHNFGESFIFYGLGKASSSKTYFPRPSVVNQLNTIDTNLALLGNSMFILVLLSGFSILMGRMHILGT